MNLNKALWEKGDFTRIAETMRESGEALVQRIGGLQRASRFWISAAAMERRQYRPQSLERKCWASISRGTWSRPGTSGRRNMASPTASSKKAMRAICTSAGPSV